MRWHNSVKNRIAMSRKSLEIANGVCHQSQRFALRRAKLAQQLQLTVDLAHQEMGTVAVVLFHTIRRRVFVKLHAEQYPRGNHPTVAASYWTRCGSIVVTIAAPARREQLNAPLY